MFFRQPEWHLRMYPFWSLKSVVLSFQWIKWGSSFLYIFVFHQALMPHPFPWSQQYRLLDLVTKLKSVQWSNLIIYWDGDQPYDRSEGFLTITTITWHLVPSNNHKVKILVLTLKLNFLQLSPDIVFPCCMR